MVMVLPAMVTDAVAGGLAGGPFGGAFGVAGWVDNAAATNRRLVQIRKRFMVVHSLGTNPCRKHLPPTQRLSHRKTVLGKPVRNIVWTTQNLRKTAFLSQKRAFWGQKRGKIGGLELLIRQHGKNVSY